MKTLPPFSMQSTQIKSDQISEFITTKETGQELKIKSQLHKKNS